MMMYDWMTKIKCNSLVIHDVYIVIDEIHLDYVMHFLACGKFVWVAHGSTHCQ